MTRQRGPIIVVVVTADDVVFETERTVVRQWRESEADRVLDILGRWEVARWLGNDPQPLHSRDEAVERIQRWRERYAEGPRFGCWAVEEKANGVAAGSVVLAPLPNGSGEVEIGWHFHPDSWGRGLASESARGALAKGFTDGLDEIYALTHLDNEASKRVCRAIGMRDVGVIHDRWYPGASQLFRIRRTEWAAS